MEITTLTNYQAVASENHLGIYVFCLKTENKVEVDCGAITAGVCEAFVKIYLNSKLDSMAVALCKHCK